MDVKIECLENWKERGSGGEGRLAALHILEMM